MKTRHVEDQLLPYLAGELAASERGGVDAHLIGCAGCRDTLRDFERLATDLGRSSPPALHWGAYRVELRDKLSDRQGRPGGRAGESDGRFRPLPLALAAGLVGIMIYVGGSGFGGRGNGDLVAIENAILASRLDLISRLDLVQRLDLLEDFEVIRRLDGLPRGEG